MQELALELKNIEKSYSGKTILAINNLKVYQNDKIGIIGENVQGKSTLINIINKLIEPDKGEIQSMIDFQYFKQVENNQSVDFEKVDPEIVSRFKVPLHCDKFYSGGEETRSRLAEVFSNYSMGLLMDEPTTHLDGDGVRFLIDELTYYYGTLIVVSHDRMFLDQVVDNIWEVKDGSVNVFNGNYTSYVEQKEQQELDQERKHQNFVKEKGRLEKSVKKKQEQALKMSKVSQKNKSKNIRPSRLSSTKQKDTIQKAAHKTARAIEKRIDHLDVVDRTNQSKDIQFPNSSTIEIHNPYPIMGDNINISAGNSLLLKNVNFQFKLGKRIGLSGPNGSGKTSLQQHIIEEKEGVKLSPKVKMSVFKQMDYKLIGEINVLHYLLQDSDYQESVIRAVLSNLGFSQDELSKSICHLSGGEATRLVLAKQFTDPSNVLILDEPTNFIDVKTIEALEKLIKAYKGTVIFTSHDSYFMKRLAEEVWEIKAKGLVLSKY